MMDADTRRFIQKEIARQMNIILSGAAGTNTMITENIEQLYPGMPTIENRPIMHPYGFASRAPQGTIQVTGKQGEHLGNRMVLGHRAKDKPNMEVGESVVYSVSGYTFKAKNGSLSIGKNGTDETIVVGDTLAEALIALIDALATHTHLEQGDGNQTDVPNNAATITAVKTSYISNGKILAKDGGRF